jgi:hypothetical protein
MTVNGGPDETRAFARLPGLDIAVLHRGAHGNEGEQVVVALRAAPSFGVLGRPVGAADPLLLWMGLTQAVWATWLGCLAAATRPPWLTRGE